MTTRKYGSPQEEDKNNRKVPWKSKKSPDGSGTGRFPVDRGRRYCVGGADDNYPG